MSIKRFSSQLPKPTIAVSACLMGHAVRYDGSAKEHKLIAHTIEPFLTIMPVCPESEAGLGTPRPPVQLIDTARGIQARGVADETLNVTQVLNSYANGFHQAHGKHITGLILKSRSPSCGTGNTPIYKDHRETRKDDGLFARVFTDKKYIVTNEDQLDCEANCNKFVMHCYALYDYLNASPQLKAEVFHFYKEALNLDVSENAFVDFLCQGITG